MIGFYDYTVILTYLSLMSGTIGVMLCLNGMGHPYLGMFFLLFSGLCDTFDGKVARSKKDRTTQMKKFGIQIDSLSDLIAFGMLPACIGIAMLRYTMCIPDLSGSDPLFAHALYFTDTDCFKPDCCFVCTCCNDSPGLF